MMNEDARRHTVEYHEHLYRERVLFEPGSWLRAPASFVMDQVAGAQLGERPYLLDLGCGVGRHAIPVAKLLGPGARVHCVDLLATALRRLLIYAEQYGVSRCLETEQADVERITIAPATYDAVLACSCLEHLSSTDAVDRALGKITRGTREGGLNVLMIGSDYVRKDRLTGARLPSCFELEASRPQLERVIVANYASWNDFRLTTKTWWVQEAFRGTDTILTSTCLMVTARRPSSHQSVDT